MSWLSISYSKWALKLGTLQKLWRASLFSALYSFPSTFLSKFWKSRYAKIGEKRPQASKNQVGIVTQTNMADKTCIFSYCHVFYQINILPLQGESTLASISQPADEFTFGHTGHMAIILGRLATLIPSFKTNLVMLIVSLLVFSSKQLTYVYQEWWRADQAWLVWEHQRKGQKRFQCHQEEFPLNPGPSRKLFRPKEKFPFPNLIFSLI